MSISVHDRQNGKKGYQVRVMRRGKLYTKYFTSKRQAEAYQRELLASLPAIKSQKGVPKSTKPPNTGIKRIVKRTFQRAGRNPVNVFTVYWRTPQGAPRYSNISIDHWGEKKALQLAKRKRREKDALYLADDATSQPTKRRKAVKKETSPLGVAKAIPDPADRFDQVRTLAELLSQCEDVHVDRAFQDNRVLTQRGIDQFIPGKCPPGLPDERIE